VTGGLATTSRDFSNAAMSATSMRNLGRPWPRRVLMSIALSSPLRIQVRTFSDEMPQLRASSGGVILVRGVLAVMASSRLKVNDLLPVRLFEYPSGR
jgi:hypothetical protein